MTSLRPYQQECLRSIRDRYRAGVRRQLISLPTGTGKTIIFASFPRFFRIRHRMLVLAHREELLEQARAKVLRANPGLRAEIEQGGRMGDPDSDVLIASVPTLGRRDSHRLSRLDLDTFRLVVVDEAHHSTAPTYRRVLEALGLFERDSSKLLVGFTATPKRGDGDGLGDVYQEITFSRTLPEMIHTGFLAPVAAYRIETDIDLSEVRVRRGDFVTRHLSQAVNVDERNEMVVRVFQERLHGRQTLCFCVDVAHAESLAQAFRESGIRASAVTGEMPREQRRDALAAFGAGETMVLTNCMVLTEGYDEPSVAGIILARPTKSSLLYTQMIGRGTRLHPGKENVIVVDVVDATRDHKLVTLPSLFGLGETFDLEGHTTKEVEEALSWVEHNRPWVRRDLATSLSDLRYRCHRIDLFDLELPEELGGVARYAWAARGGGDYALPLGSRETLVVASTILGDWEIVLRKPGSEEKLGSRQECGRAVEEAERWVAGHRESALALVQLRSGWRKKPASEKQTRVLRSKGIKVPEGLTKGQASHLISMLLR